MSQTEQLMSTEVGTAQGAHIEVTDVYHYFESKSGEPVLAVDRTSISIEPGEFVCFVGPSGCGKTTVLNQIAGLITPTGGTVTLDGKKAQEGRPDVGYLLARDGLLPWRTALDNVMLPLELRKVPKAEATERATAMLELVGLGKFLHSYPTQLSHGMRQRTALSRTLVMEPTTILMDEPFSALDAETRLRLQGEFLKLWEHHRSSVAFVTHDLSEAIVMADRILVFSARPGKIIADYKIDLPRPRDVLDLQSNDRYHEYFQDIWSVLRKELAA